MGARALAVAALGILCLPATASAHRDAPPPSAVLAASDGAQAAAAPASCEGDGDPFVPDEVITGEFDAEREGSYVLLPFDVPDATTAVRVRYCYDQPETPASELDSHTLDLGLYEPRDDDRQPWGIDEFRGWGGSSHPDVIVSPYGFTGDARYERDPEDQVPGRTTRAFLPGPIPRGEWAVELGLASIASQPGDSDGKVAYRVEIETTAERFPFRRYRPAPYDSSPVRSKARWYAGDFHVHGEHSALGDAPLEEVFDYAFGSAEDGKAGLDFITLSDYVSGSSWGEVGRYQDDYPRSLIIRSAEVITYQGHANSHANTGVVDYRHGPLLERRPDGGLVRVRRPRPASEIFDRIHSVGGFTQINHPTIFPSAVPAFSSFCRGCPWDYSDRETDYSQVDAIEIATGPPGLRGTPGQPGPNPFTVTAIEFWEDPLAAGHRIAAVGSSDSHNAGRTPNPVTQAPIGTATTVVRAPELSEQGVERGVRAGHTYVKVYGADGPDLRFSAVPTERRGRRAIMGDVLEAARARFDVRVMGAARAAARPGPLELLVIRDGAPFRAVPVTRDDLRYAFTASRPGRYRLQVQRGTAIEAVSSPIYLERRSPDEDPGDGGEPPRDADRDGDRGGGGAAGGRGASGGSGANGLAALPSNDGAVESAADASRSAGELPFTGLGLAALAFFGAVLLGLGGVALRRIYAR